jgi:hypothetical protein
MADAATSAAEKLAGLEAGRAHLVETRGRVRAEAAGGARGVGPGELVVAPTTWRAGFALVALFPLAGYVVLRRVT